MYGLEPRHRGLGRIIKGILQLRQGLPSAGVRVPLVGFRVRVRLI